MTDESLYNLRANATQMRVIQQALELFARIGLGQLDEILDHPTVQRLQADGKIRERVTAKKLLSFVKLDMFDLSQHDDCYTLHSGDIPDVVRIAWDCQAAVRHRLAWDRIGNPAERNPVTMAAVDFDDIDPVSAQPLPTIEAVKPVAPEPDVFFPTEIRVVAGGADLMCVINAYNPEVTIDLTSLLKRSPPTDALKPGDQLQPGTRFKAKVNLAAGTSKLQVRDIGYTADLYDDEEVLWAEGAADAFLHHYAKSSELATKALAQILIDCYRYGRMMADSDIPKLADLFLERWLPLLRNASQQMNDLVALLGMTKREGIQDKNHE